MPADAQAPSPRREELLEKSYQYVLEHGLTDLSLRPLAAAVGSSPRVLLFLFESKEGLIREILHRARADEIERLADVRRHGGAHDTQAVVLAVWNWLAEPVHRRLLVLWLEVYTLSLADGDGPWADFAARTVEDWLELLAASQQRPGARVRVTERTLILAVLRGLLLDLLATGDIDRTTGAVRSFLHKWYE